MPSFAELYCQRLGCAPHQFQRLVFWRTLYWWAMPLAPLLLLSEHFSADFALINACGRATSMQQVHEAFDDRRSQLQLRGWLRNRLNLRVSTRRLRNLAESYLGRRNHRRGLAVVAEGNLPTANPTDQAMSNFRPVFRAAPLASPPPSTPSTRIVEEEFSKPLRSFTQN